MCNKCYKKNRCFEQRGICSEYRDIEAIREEIRKANDDWSRDSGTRTVNAVVRGRKIYAEIQVGAAAEVLRDGLDEDFGTDNT